MGKPSEPPDSADAAERRHRSARLLGELVTVDSEAELEDFLRRRVGRQLAPDLAGLRAARDLLEELGAALQVGDEAQWKRIVEARQHLREAAFDPLLETLPASTEAPTSPLTGLAPPPPAVGAVPPPAAPPQQPSPWANAATTSPHGARGPSEPPAAAPRATGGAALPFSGRKAAPPPTALAELEESDDIPLDQTAAAVGGKAMRKTMPFSPVGPEGTLPELTVEQYASYRATCAVYPEREDVTLQQYGVTTPELRRALDERWQERFATDAELRARYQALLSKFAVWLRKHR